MSLLRHIQACNNYRLPGDRVKLSLGGRPVGWMQPEAAEALVRLGATRAGGVDLDKPAALPTLAHQLAEKGFYHWRDEAFDVRSAEGAVLTQVDRGALPLLGIAAEGMHLNGLVRRTDGLHIWVARRAADKLLDPGKLDHVVAGGISAGMDAAGTLAKEAEEEAGLAPTMVAGASYHGIVGYTMMRAEGLRRDRLHCFDLVLPEGFTPRPLDGEVAGFELWPAQAVLDTVRPHG